MADRMGTHEADTLTGTSEADFLRGRGGVDTLDLAPGITSETLSDGRVRVFRASSAVSCQSDDPFGFEPAFDFDGGGLFG